ncbi:unnamed protein product, partial [Didymodactylos carnosus]
AIRLELHNLEEAAKKSSSPANVKSMPLDREAEIPANTQIQTSVSVERVKVDYPAHIAFKMKTSNDTIIRTVTVFAEGLFKGECLVVHPAANQVRESLVCPVIPPRDIALDLHVQVFVGLKSSILFHVFELSRPLPTFSMYALIPNTLEEPKGFVTFYINERIARIVVWINHHFLLQEEYSCSTALNIQFLALRTEQKLIIKMQTNGQMTIMTDDMELAGNIIQSMAKFLNIEDLQTTCEFPSELEILSRVFSHVCTTYCVGLNGK